MDKVNKLNIYIICKPREYTINEKDPLEVIGVVLWIFKHWVLLKLNGRI